MSKFSLVIDTPTKIYVCDAIGAHQIPRVGETVKVGDLYDLPGSDVSVTAVSHPIVIGGGGIHLPIVVCKIPVYPNIDQLRAAMEADFNWTVTDNTDPNSFLR